MPLNPLKPPAARVDVQTDHWRHLLTIALDHVDSRSYISKAQVASAIREACINVGFFYVKNHGIDEAAISSTLDISRRFFDLPLEGKMKIDFSKTPNFRGYYPMAQRRFLPESYEMGPDIEASPDIPMNGRNVWPSEDAIPGFKEIMLKYYLHLVYYPPQSLKVGGQDCGVGAHTNFQFFTILWQDDHRALQVQNASGQWIDADPIPGTFVINLADQLARWTNEIFKSTVHRAIHISETQRYSIPLFFGIDYNVNLEVLPSCVSESRPARYEPILAGECLKARMEKAYGYAIGK
ncbi:hypothetical protein B0J17DRAFT_695744 [Rhizoctonia solani]|nr:hypothetical protein B0J17DRAFT_695744 [Rhizoctonia solani]